MIPSLVVLGLALGRWWRTTLAVGVVGLFATGVIGWGGVPPAAGLALANTAAGMFVHQGVLRALRAIRSGDPAAV